MTVTRLGSRKAADLRRERRWYVTTTHVQQYLVEGEFVARPAATAHAKEMGSLTTACGVWAYSWQHMLDLAFPVPRLSGPTVQQCGACVERVIGEW